MIQTFMAIMSQLFWGVTVGALTAAFTSIAQWVSLGIALACGATAAGWAALNWKRGRKP